ncbi:MAG: RNB domain-containing ribonuclease [Betaproteobacteria bacterium]
MYILFEDAGKFLAGRILSEAEASMQVELDSGKRVKVKAAQALIRFDKPAPAELLRAGTELAREIDLNLAWEFASEDEFGFADLAREYFGPVGEPAPTEQAAALLALYEAPHYFRRAGKGRFKKASAEILQQALAAIEKRKQIAAQIETWAGELAAGRCPAPIQEQLYKILFKPDKNSPEYKAVVLAAQQSHKAPLDLLQQAGAITSAYQFHWRRFLFDNFPKGTQFPPLQAPSAGQDLPLAPVRAFSIDDSSTTEIDDALSVRGLGSGRIELGIHIAAPALALQPGDAIDQLGRTRLSTVYMPGHKLTMLPDAVVQSYTLQAGRDCPAVSLYVSLDEASLQVLGSQTRIERVPIAENLRHDQLDGVFNEDFFARPAAGGEPAWGAELRFLHRLAKQLKLDREQVRGKPETFNRPDYTFRLDQPEGQEPSGQEVVSIGLRQRGAPLDLIVAEAMILANRSWGLWLSDLGVPGIYRSQASMAPGVKVRMGTKALPHAGLGVPAYAWSTSPLRRYVDLVNQWQIIACARHGATAALAAPFKPKDVELFSIISAFDAAYGAYNAYQASIERYWTLRHVQQQGIKELTATVVKDDLVRADSLPLVLPAAGAQGLARGAPVRVRLGDIDEITLSVTGTVIERLDQAAGAGIDEEELEGSESEFAAGPISIAVDLSPADGEDPPAGGAPAPQPPAS